MLDFDERDLVRHAQDAGFAEIELELRVSVKNRKEPIPWERYLRISGNPLVPTIGEALDRVLSPQEAAMFTEHLRPLVESGTGRQRTALAYLTAVKGIVSERHSAASLAAAQSRPPTRSDVSSLAIEATIQL